MADVKKEFFILLRAGLWDKTPDSSVFNEKTDWNQIYKRSKQQALLGIILDGIEKLPKEKYPPRILYIKWCAEVLHIEDENRKIDSEVVNLFRFLRENGVQPILLKGQGIARNYHHPYRRSSGDIDIYIGEKDYRKVNKLLSLEGTSTHGWSEKHMEYTWHGVSVENHKILATPANPKSDRNLRRLIDNWYTTDALINCKINGEEITVPPLEFDAVFILMHSVWHFINVGIGLRQICDWAVLLDKKYGIINIPEAQRIMKELGMVEASRIFGALIVDYLGFDKNKLLFSYSQEDEKMAKEVLEDIWEKGNFGTVHLENNLQKGWWKSKSYKLKYKITRFKKFKAVAPGEIKWLPVWSLKHNLKNLFGIT